jgi:CheY-like chemotaxis protein
VGDKISSAFLKDLKILIAEDQLINVEVLKQNLRELNLLDGCHFAFNGEDAVKQAIKTIEAQFNFESQWREGTIQPLSLCLFDFQMPKMNGLEAIKKIRFFVNHLNAGESGLRVKPPLFILQTAYMTT